MNLSQLKPGSRGEIVFIGGQGAFRRRLLDMGMTPKTEVIIRKIAPFGDPIVIHLRGYELTIRREEAEKIQISEVG